MEDKSVELSFDLSEKGAGTDAEQLVGEPLLAQLSAHQPDPAQCVVSFFKSACRLETYLRYVQQQSVYA